MPRLLSALKEWLALRARMREERQFHLDRSAADLRALGLTSGEAKRTARARFGSRHNSRRGLHELGGDLNGLLHLFRAYRVLASVWFQPVILLAVVTLLFAASPSRREIVEGLLGHTLGDEGHSEVSLSVYGSGPASPGITLQELDALHSMATLTHVELAGPHLVVARPVGGATLMVIAAEAGNRTGNRGFYATWLERDPAVMTSPAKVAWVLIAVCGVFFLYTRTRERVTPRWLLYVVFVAGLHSLASILAWALAIQVWNRASPQTPIAAALSFSVIVVIYLLTAAAQCLCCWHDLSQRCPVCLDRLLLASTQGEPDRILLNMPVTESICAHGHGVLSESRWSRTFGELARI